MAAFIRASRHLPLQTTRNLIATQQNIKKTCMQWGCNKLTAHNLVSKNFNIRSLSTPATKKPTSSFNLCKDVHSQLEFLENHVGMHSRIDKEYVLAVLTQAKTEGKINEAHSLMLLRSTGSLLIKESLDVRNDLLNQVWDSIQQLGVKPTIQHYNVKLRTMMENGVKLLPADVLAGIEAQELQPNRTTFQTLIDIYCGEGDIEGARKILEHMKEQDMRINESVFNSLIKGYLKSGARDEAQTVISSMREAHLDPSCHTYMTMAQEFAEKGDITAMQEVIEEAIRDEEDLKYGQLLELYFSLWMNGNSDGAVQILDRIKHMRRYSDNAMNCMYKLVLHGHTDAVNQFFQAVIDGDTLGSPWIHSVSPNIIRHMVMCNWSFESVMKFKQQFETQGVEPVNLAVISYFANLEQKPDFNLRCLETAEKEGIELKSYYFQAIFRDFAAEKNIEGMYNAAQLLISSECNSNEIVNTLATFCVESLCQLGEDQDTVIRKLQEQGLKDHNVNGLKLLLNFRQGNHDAVADLLQNGNIALKPTHVRFHVRAAFDNSKDIDSFLQDLTNIGRLFSDVRWFYSEAVLRVLNPNVSTKEKARELVLKIVEKEMPLQQRKQFEAEKLKALDLDDELITNLSSLCVADGSSQGKPKSTEFYRKMDIKALEKALDQGQQINVPLLKTLLTEYCIKGNVEKAEETLRTLESSGFILYSYNLRKLAEMYARKGNLEKALNYKQKLLDEYPQNKNWDYLNVHIATLQIKEGQFEAAIETLQSAHPESLRPPPDTLKMLMYDMLRMCSEKFTPSQTEQLAQALFDLNYLIPGAWRVLDLVVGAYSKNGDMEGMIQKITEYSSVHRWIPVNRQVLKVLINNEDAQNLQTVVDLGTAAVGEKRVLHSLLESFIECGKIKQAKKVVKTPGLRAHMAALSESLDYFSRNNKETELEHLVDITKELNGANRDHMLSSLIKYHGSKGNWKKAIDVYGMYEDEGITASPHTLGRIAMILKSNNQPVPFEVPEGYSELYGEERPASSTLDSDLLQELEKSNLEAALQTMKSIYQSGELLGTRTSFRLAKMLMKQRKTILFREMIKEMANKGDLQGLLFIRNAKLDPTFFIDTRVFIAAVHCNQVKDILPGLNNLPNGMESFISLEGLQLLSEKSPEDFNVVEDRIKSSLRNSSEAYAVNHLFSHWVLAGQYTQAESLLNLMSASQGPKLNELVVECRRKKNEEAFRWLLETTRKLKATPKLSLLYSNVILLKCEQSDWEGAVDYYEQAQEDGLDVQQLWARPMLQLEALLQQNQKPVPWEIGTIQAKVNKQELSYENDSSSSSSDSESDSDTEQRQQR